MDWPVTEWSAWNYNVVDLGTVPRPSKLIFGAVWMMFYMSVHALCLEGNIAAVAMECTLALNCITLHMST